MLCVGSMFVYMLVASSLNSFAPFAILPNFSKSIFTWSDLLV